jgi:Cu/Ag efflux protein CusF
MLRTCLRVAITFSLVAAAALGQDGPQNGRIKKVDAENGTITITAEGKDHELVVTDRSRLMDGGGRAIESRLKDERLKEGTQVLFRGVERDGRLVLDGLRLGGDGGRPREGQGGEIRRAKVKKLDIERMTITLSADGKDHELALSETETQVLGGAGKDLSEKLKDFKDGADVQFLAGSRDGKAVLRGIRLADAPGNRPAGPAARVSPDTSKFKPITELGDAEYQGFKGGLYPDRKNDRPAAHEAAGVALARSVQPLDEDGKPSDDGKVVLLSIGMSNATQEFSAFKRNADRDAERNPKLVIVDGAQGGMTAAVIRRTDDGGRGQQFWTTVDQRLDNARVTREQVQAAWVKEADAGPTQPFPQHARLLQSELADIARVLHERFANLKLVYFSSRTYGGYATTRLNPEPYAYESGFAVKWLIEQQITGDESLNFDAAKGAVKSPWLSWGPYLWANGAQPREDGFYYNESDFGGDGTHPSPPGQQKVAELMLKFFKSDTTTQPWFLAGRPVKYEAADDNPNNRPTETTDAELPPLLQMLDRDRDGRLSRDELDQAESVVMKLDRDEDGLVDREEIARATGRRRGGGGRPGEIITPAARGERYDTSLEVGDEAPDFTLPDLAGKREVTLSSFRGKRPVVLVFTSFT